MAKNFKKNQPVVATLPTGRVVEGVYVEPWGEDGHSIYVDEYEGERGGKAVYNKVMYGVKDDCIESMNSVSSAVSDAQYKAWLKRAMVLEERINDDKKSLSKLESGSKEEEKLKKKIERNQSKLDQINEKISEFEGEE